jgi:2-C-methyl-D-erythritol 4-phosphate cytidylyltransferase
MSDSELNKKHRKETHIKHLQKVWVVIPAAGIGERMQSDIPKQYLKINNKTVLEHTLNCFLFHPDVAGIIVVLNSDDYYWKNIKLNSNHDKPIYTVEGGKERSDSVIQGLDYLLMVEQLAEDSWVMVHDAARPCLIEKDINSLLSIRTKESTGGILASPVRDTMKRAVANNVTNKNIISKTESREDLWHALTPQLFRIGELKDAIITCQEKNINITDESSALEATGKQVELVEGSMNNIKITQQSDFEMATLLLTSLLAISTTSTDQGAS